MSSRRVPKNRALKKLLGVWLRGTKNTSWASVPRGWHVMHNGDRTTEWRESCFGRSSKYFAWTVVEIFCLDGRQNLSFGRSSKFVVWTVAKILRLDGHRNLSFGPASKIWTLEFFLDGHRKISFGRSRQIDG